MEQKVDFVKIGTVIFRLDQLLSIGMLDDYKNIRVEFKDTTISPVIINFVDEDTARNSFHSAVEILCNPWVGQ